jgi:hypothetical protein
VTAVSAVDATELLSDDLRVFRLLRGAEQTMRCAERQSAIAPLVMVRRHTAVLGFVGAVRLYPRDEKSLVSLSHFEVGDKGTEEVKTRGAPVPGLYALDGQKLPTFVLI